jgi:exonuclease SbcC
MLFRGIHAPQEFDGVRFNGDIFLNRRGGSECRLTEISTGQRSALLDSLRELVINGNRQMFFATANAKVANLFARKFDFLGDSFRDITLDRADS